MITDSITKIGDAIFYKCTSLTSIMIPDLIPISFLAFKEFYKIITINALFFSTTTFGNSPDELKYLLVKAGFDHINLDTIIYGDADYIIMHYNIKAWGRQKDEVSGHLFLCTVAARCLTWVDMRQIFCKYTYNS